MKQKIKDFIYRMDNVSFAELTREIPESAGERMMCIDNDSLIIWSGVSQEFAEAVEDLVRDGDIFYQRTSPAVYEADRLLPSGLPVADCIRMYPKPHWLPVVLRPKRPS